MPGVGEAVDGEGSAEAGGAVDGVAAATSEARADGLAAGGAMGAAARRLPPTVTAIATASTARTVTNGRRFTRRL
jgi:hypothetical protein